MNYTGVIGIVEATNYESLCLWREAMQRKESWVTDHSGILETVGRLANRPVCISLLIIEVKGYRILFMEATSQVVDHVMIEDWLKKNIPSTAFNERGYLNKTDAMNFNNLFL